ncbi:MAG: hypothetical protein ABEK12_02820, partial [Candidatus Nanohaloarchaea archaeon]
MCYYVMRRRDMLAAVSSPGLLVLGVRTGATFSRYAAAENASKYVTPDDPVVQDVASDTRIELQEGTYKVDWPDRLEFEDVETGTVDHPRDYLSGGAQRGNCADHAVASASVMAAKEKDVAVVTGETQYGVIDRIWPGAHSNAEIAHDGEVLVADVTYPYTLYRRPEFRRRHPEWNQTAMSKDG